MSQFAYINDINSALGGMDGDLTRGPMPRWQKKLETSSTSSHNSSVNNSKLSVSYNNACAGNGVSIPGKTPNKGSGRKTPTGKTPGKKTPGSKDRSKTPTGGDRFIPSRATSNFELGHYMINKEQQKDSQEEENSQTDNTKRSAAQMEQRKLLAETIPGANGEAASQRILSYQIKAPSAPDSHQNPLKVVYSTKTPVSTKSGSRYIPHAPERILDAPDIINDYCEYFQFYFNSK